MNILFVCNQNENRSKTAEELFKNRFNTKSAGLYNDSPLTKEELMWADMVVVMEDSQRSEIGKRFPLEYLKKRIISLDISDIYQQGQKELIAELKRKIELLI